LKREGRPVAGRLFSFSYVASDKTAKKISRIQKFFCSVAALLGAWSGSRLLFLSLRSTPLEILSHRKCALRSYQRARRVVGLALNSDCFDPALLNGFTALKIGLLLTHRC